MNIQQISRDDDGKTIEMHVGDILAIMLPENPTTGYRWNTTALDPGILEPEQTAFEVRGTAIGGGGIRTFCFQAKMPGISQLALKLSQPWERSRPVGSVYCVTVAVSK